MRVFGVPQHGIVPGARQLAFSFFRVPAQCQDGIAASGVDDVSDDRTVVRFLRKLCSYVYAAVSDGSPYVAVPDIDLRSGLDVYIVPYAAGYLSETGASDSRGLDLPRGYRAFLKAGTYYAQLVLPVSDIFRDVDVQGQELLVPLTHEPAVHVYAGPLGRRLYVQVYGFILFSAYVKEPAEHAGVCRVPFLGIVHHVIGVVSAVFKPVAAPQRRHGDLLKFPFRLRK